MSEPGPLERSSLSPLALAVLAGVVFAANLAYRAFRSRIRNGHYELTEGVGKLNFKSRLGLFTFDKEAGVFEAAYANDRKVKLSFDDIRNIELITEDVEAMLEEFVFEGFALFIDSSKKYRDMVQKYSIVVVTNDFKRYPLIAMKQYVVKDLLNLAVTLQLDLLAMMRMYMPVDLYAQNLYARLKDVLGKEFRFDKEL